MAVRRLPSLGLAVLAGLEESGKIHWLCFLPKHLAGFMASWKGRFDSWESTVSEDACQSTIRGTRCSAVV
ncbi:hypothetical protein OAL01_04460 [Rubripirellula sp.]|nr:hypothetical protein [Rubripirellula sp.]